MKDSSSLFFSIIKLRDNKHPVIVRVLKWISLLKSLVKSARMKKKKRVLGWSLHDYQRLVRNIYLHVIGGKKKIQNHTRFSTFSDAGLWIRP